MVATHLLGVDVGTQSSKGALVTVDGHVVAHCAVDHAVSRPFPGWAEQDADKVWWNDVARLIRGLLRQCSIDPSEVAAVGVSALGPAMVPVNDEGRPLRPGMLYGIDTRAQAEIERLNRELGWDTPDAPLASRLQAQSVAPKVMWFRDHEPEFWRKTSKILGATSYVVHRLTGAYVVDPGNAEAWTPFYDPARGSWDTAMCERFGVPVGMLRRFARRPMSLAGSPLRLASKPGCGSGRR